MPNWGEPSGSRGSFSDPSDDTDESWIKPDEPKSPLTCSCGQPLVLRHRQRDNHPFYGCSTFPKCRKTFSAKTNWPGNPQFWPDYPDDQEDGWRDWGDL